MTQNKIFDETYVGIQPTAAPDEKLKSTTKDFLKNPVSQDDIKKYGSSKPTRIVINAQIIKHGQSKKTK